MRMWGRKQADKLTTCSTQFLPLPEIFYSETTVKFFICLVYKRSESILGPETDEKHLSAVRNLGKRVKLVPDHWFTAEWEEWLVFPLVSGTNWASDPPWAYQQPN